MSKGDRDWAHIFADDPRPTRSTGSLSGYKWGNKHDTKYGVLDDFSLVKKDDNETRIFKKIKIT
jgi:hypothetical protein